MTRNLAALRLPVAPWLVALAALASGAVDGTILSIWSYLHLMLLPLGPLSAVAAAGPLTRSRVALVAVAFAGGFAVVYLGSRALGIGGTLGAACAPAPC